MDYFTKLTGILFKPLKVLEEYKSEEGIKEPFIFMIISAIIAGAISFIFQMIVGTTITTSTLSFGTTILSNLIFVFGFSGIFHLLVKLFGGPNPYFQTFKAFAYMSAFWIVGTVVAGLSAFLPILGIVNFILGLWVLILLGSCLKHYTDLSSGKLVAIWLIIIVLIVVILFTAMSTIMSLIRAPSLL